MLLRPMTTANTDGSTKSLAVMEKIKPPTTARPSGAVCSPPSPMPRAIGIMPAIMAKLVMIRGRSRRWAASTAATPGLVAVAAEGLGKVGQQDRVGGCHADGHDQADKRLDVERCARYPQRHRRTGDHRRHRRDRSQRQPHRLEVGGQEQENDDDGHDQSDRQALQQPAAAERAEHLLHRHHLAANVDLRSARRRAGGLQGAVEWPITRPRSSPSMLAVMLSSRRML